MLGNAAKKFKVYLYEYCGQLISKGFNKQMQDDDQKGKSNNLVHFSIKIFIL